MPSLNQRICSVEDCERSHYGKTLCKYHYNIEWNKTHKDSLAKSNKYFRKTHPLYTVWQAMRQRCYDINTNSYEYYGGRGITVCERWRNSYHSFVADMGERPTAKHQLDRVDPDGNYEPSNCRWVTTKEQANNKRKGAHSVINITQST